MSDFGKWFEAAEHAAARIILEANAAQPDSAPASKDVAASNAERFPAGMGVDLVEKLCASIARATADSIETPESAYDWGASDAKRALLARIESLERDAERWRYLQRNITFYNVGESPRPSLASVSKRIWYHATDCMEWPFSAAIDAARKEGK